MRLLMQKAEVSWLMSITIPITQYVRIQTFDLPFATFYLAITEQHIVRTLLPAYLNVDEQYAFYSFFYERQLNKHIPDDVQFNVDCNRACDGFYASLWLVKRRQFHIGTTSIFYDIWVYFFCGSENKYVSGFLLNC